MPPSPDIKSEDYYKAQNGACCLPPLVAVFMHHLCQVLGVDRSASDSEIAKAYKKLALKCGTRRAKPFVEFIDGRRLGLQTQKYRNEGVYPGNDRYSKLVGQPHLIA